MDREEFYFKPHWSYLVWVWREYFKQRVIICPYYKTHTFFRSLKLRDFFDKNPTAMQSVYPLLLKQRALSALQCLVWDVDNLLLGKVKPYFIDWELQQQNN